MRVGIIGHLLSFEPTYRQAGVSRYTEALVRELPSLAPDDDFVVFTGPTPAPTDRGFHPRTEWVRARLPTGQPIARIGWEQTVGTTVARRHGLDLIHAPVNVTPIVSGVPRIVTIHDLAFHLYPEQYPGAKQRYLRLMTRLSVLRATRVITVSNATRDDVIRLYGADPDRVVTVPNGVSDEYRPLAAEDIARFRREHNLPDQFILFVGTLQPRKNVETLLKAYARVTAEAGWPLIIVGAPGWDYETIYSTARDLGLTGTDGAERVRFVGFAPPETLPLWYNAAGMLIYPALYEGFGLPLLEAMACGTPVIGADASSLPEVVGEAGLLVQPKDVDAMGRAMLTLTRMDEMRADLRERGLRRAAEFTWRRTAAETLSVYRDALASPDPHDRSFRQAARTQGSC